VTRTVVTLRAPVADRTFRALGTTVRLLAVGHGAPAAIEQARATVLGYHARLSRFLARSELSELNRDPRTTVPASKLLRSAVAAGLWAAERSGGLVDPCLLDALEGAGYADSHRSDGVVRLPNGPPSPARPDPELRWRAVRIDDAAAAIVRPAGLRLDLGGTGKGHVADLVAAGLARFDRWAVDCGGDVRVGGEQEVLIAHPLHDRPAARLVATDLAVATSSVVARTWRSSDGVGAHHLLDPSTGRPVSSGLLTATALAPTTLEAEVLAKVALLGGPARARSVLAPFGGLMVHSDGSVEKTGADIDLEAA
jgi:thiamine biosynthesis lipoprotein